MSKKMARSISEGLYVGTYILCEMVLLVSVRSNEFISSKTSYLLVLSRQRICEKSGEILKYAHRRHCGFCSFLCLDFIEQYIQIMPCQSK